MRAARHLRPLLTATLTSPRARGARRAPHELGRNLRRAPQRVHCFHQVEIARRSA